MKRDYSQSVQTDEKHEASSQLVKGFKLDQTQPTVISG